LIGGLITILYGCYTMEINLIDTLSIWKKSGEMEIDNLIRNSDSWVNKPIEPKAFEELNSAINLSKQHKIILWLWKKCGTSHMAKIMNKYDFKYYRIENDSLTLIENNVVQKHYCNLFHGHENYKILSAVRNPYSRFFSEYTFNRRPEEFIYNEINKENFRFFIYQSTVYSDIISNECVDFSQRIPDYPVRLENLYEDYSKIPFITNSEYFKSGELKKDVGIKINVSNENDSLWKKFYTQEIADIIYYRMPRYFELFGYDKNSWKK
jgi:hypothetical protein